MVIPMPTPSPLLPLNALASAWQKALVHGDASTPQGELALAMALAYPQESWDGMLVGPEKQERPALHWALSKNLSTERNNERRRRGLSWESEWPEDVTKMNPWERLAAHLLRAGADPWLKDSEGLDALDWAFRSGARSVLGLLLDHPACPSLDKLRARVDDYPGRRVPWLHGAAYRGHLHLFQDLLDRGWLPTDLDRQGWTALSWVNTTSAQEGLRPHYAFLSNEQKVELRHSWVRRKTMKLYPVDFKLGILIDGFEKAFPLGGAVLQSSEEQKTLTNLLAVKPGSANRYKGVSADAVMGDANKEFDAFFERHWAVVGTGTGAARGTWSLPAAGLWAALRQNNDKLPAIAEAFVQRLEKGGGKAWLNAPLKPADKGGKAAVLQGGLGWLAVTSVHTRDGYDRPTIDRIKRLEVVWEDGNGRLRGLEEAVAFTRGYCGAAASDDWKGVLIQRWGNIMLNAFRVGELSDQEAQQWNALNEVGLRIYAEKWLLIGERLLLQPLVAPEPGQEPSARYRLAQAMLDPSGNMWSRNAGFSYASNEVPKKCRSMRLRLLRAHIQAHGGLEAAPFPDEPLFSLQDYTKALAESPALTQGLPSACSWENFLRSKALDQALPSSPAHKAAPRF